ncbi:TPA: hypothetical protein ACXIGC_001405 [Stenotrophomonas maltophilia]|jgi:hypothetical protein|uniref:hypothetical protein n=1 Tax=Stenotrophomonas TaxID=40323 RepID=UPI00066C2A8E|nr:MULTISPECIES: hypothetical protein [Stenotrophomonas]MBO8042430.1 hypothetical protein [Pseudomonas aeruginosa]EKU9963214.1 hypothetical protein [Stenotrophomonas maltophilia]MBA0335736.1 hypothetical protein [Stenotrophomonas maltophilia]MBA0540111.1 hypothetical protein [Stenotrophomonas maltophilia]MBH1511419.1 hypothetical protein [Stenotrophomonas maltophilia]
MSRAKNLSDSDVAKIVGILDGWSGRLTWEGLLDAVEKHLYARYTRQALHKHTRIQAAFEQRKLALANGDRRQRSFENLPEMQVAMDRIARLEGELARLEAENARLLEQFVRWAYNASVRGLDDVYLNSPLPVV